MIATSGFLTALECTQFDFGRGSALPWASLQHSTRPPKVQGGLLLRGGERRERRGVEEVGEGQGMEGKE